MYKERKERGERRESREGTEKEEREEKRRSTMKKESWSHSKWVREGVREQEEREKYGQIRRGEIK